MVYTSLSSKAGNYPYQLNIAHLYGNLMNTYGDNGNILMLKYVAEKLGAHVTVDIVSLHDDFDENHYDIAFFGGGQDFEQSIIASDLPAKKESIDNYIQNDGVALAICGGFQLLGQYYVEASGKRIEGLGVMGHYTLNQTNNRFIGDIKIHNEDFDETYYGFAHRIAYRDTISYFGILLDDNNRKPICRLHFNGAKKYIEFFDKGKDSSERIQIDDLDNIYTYKERLLSTLDNY